VSLSLYLLAALIIQPPAPPAKKPATVVRQTLKSGLRLIVAERPDAPLCALDLRVRVGVGDETEKTNGMAHAVEHLVFKGTADRKPGELDAAVEGLGGELSARTTRDATQFSVSLPASGWREALSELSQMTLKAAFRAEDWSAERPVIESERAYLRTDAARTGVAALSGTLWAEGEPYGLPLLGTPVGLRGYGADDLRLFWKEHYVPANMTLVVAGPVKADEVARAAEELFVGYPPGDPEPPRERPLRRSVPREKPGRTTATGGLADAQTVTLLLGWPTAPAADAHAQATLQLLAELLAPTPDSGRLAGPLVLARGVARSAVVEVQAQRAGGVFFLAVATSKKSASTLEEELRSQLMRVAEDGFSEAELALARASLRARVLAEESNVEKLAARLALYDSLDASEAADATLQKLATITSAELVRTLRLLLKTEAPASVLIEGGHP
jgi:zinc protease